MSSKAVAGIALSLAGAGVIFGRDLLSKPAKDERLAHMVALVLAALTGKSVTEFFKPKDPGQPAPVAQTV